MSEISKYVVENLTPTNPNGQSTATYELTRASVSPMRVVGRDALGRTIEDTIPTVKWAQFLHPCGSINKVPLRTGSVPSETADAKAYEIETVTELIMDGWIPAHECPYRVSPLLNMPYVPVPPGVTACGGRGTPQSDPVGCEHLHALADARKAEALRKHTADTAALERMNEEQAQRQATAIGKALGMVLNDRGSAAGARKQQIRDGRED